jgi:hypothetical protein
MGKMTEKEKVGWVQFEGTGTLFKSHPLLEVSQNCPEKWILLSFAL